MSIALSNVQTGFSKKTLLIVGVAAVLLAVAGYMAIQQGGHLTSNVSAAQPGDYGLVDGNLITSFNANGNPDVFVIKEVFPSATKRVFKNPTIGNYYGQFGANGIFTPGVIKQVLPTTQDAFVLGCYVKNADTGDPKVYYVESTSADGGTLHWVNVSATDAIAADPLFFPKTFNINNAEFNFYAQGAAYTSMSQVPVCTTGEGSPTPTPPTGPFSVALASDNPTAMTITKNAAGVNFLKVRVSGNGTVTSMTFKRQGPGQTDDFSNLYVYDGATRLTSGRSFSTSTGEVTFVGLKIAVSGTKDITFVADMDGTNNTAGNVNYVTLTAVDAGGTVSGLPVSGNNVTTSGTSSGTYDVAKVGSLGDPTVGQAQAQLSEFKITANTEGGSLRRLTMLNGGTLKASDLTNAKLTSGTQTWSGTMTSDSYLVFDLGTGLFIPKGGNAIFKVWGDTGGKKDETIDLYFENDGDVLVVGDQYNAGMAEGTNALDSAAEATTLTLKGGVLTIAFNGPNAGNIGTQATDVTLLRYSMTAASNIEIRKTEFTLCASTDGATDTTFEDASDETEWDDLTDFKVWDEDLNRAVTDSKDGTAFNDANDTGSCPDSQSGAQEIFTNTIDLLAGKTYKFKVTADIDTSLGGFLDTADIIRVVLDNYGDDAADTAVMKYAGTTTAVAAADIVPNADVSGPNITLQAATLTLGLASTPSSDTVVKGTTGVNMVGITFAAAQASKLKVTDITLTGYAEDEAADTHNEGVDTTNSGVSIANAVSSVGLYDAESGLSLGGTISSNQLSVINTGTIKFSNLAWEIPAGSTRTLLVKVNLSTNNASGSNGDFYSFDINTTSDVTALDDSSNTVNAGNADPNGATSPTKILTVKNSGSLTLVAINDGDVQKKALYWGETGAKISKFRLTSTDEAQYLENFTVAASVAAEITDAAANVKKVKLTYKNKAGNLLTAEQSFTNGASANFGFTGDSRPYVPKDSTLDILVSADLKNNDDSGATTSTDSGSNANAVFFSLDLVDRYNGSSATGFRAVGEGSGAVIDGDGTNIADVAGTNNMYVYRVFPKFTVVALPAPYNLIGTPTVFKFTVTAVGLTDSRLFFDNTAAGSGSIKFEVVASGQYAGNSAASTAFSVYDGDGDLVDNSTLTADANGPAVKASLTFDFSSLDLDLQGGQSETFSIRLTNPNNWYPRAATTGRSADYFQLVLNDDENGLINWVSNTTGSTNDLDTPSTTGTLKDIFNMQGPTFQR